MDYDVGQSVELTATFKRRVNGELTLTDPTDPVIRWSAPAGGTSGEALVGDLTHVSTGVYRTTVPLDAPGRWDFEQECTEPFATRTGDHFWVRRDRVPAV